MQFTHVHSETIKFFDVNKNGILIRKILNNYFEGKRSLTLLPLDCPDFILSRTEHVIRFKSNLFSAHKNIGDCIEKAIARNGYIGIMIYTNKKLDYFWLEFVEFPFVIGDAVSSVNIDAMFYLLNDFINFSINNPVIYGNIITGIDDDKDLKMMIGQIRKRADNFTELTKDYELNHLCKSQNWLTFSQVTKLLSSVKTAIDPWSDLIVEHFLNILWKRRDSVSLSVINGGMSSNKASPPTNYSEVNHDSSHSRSA